MTSEAFRSLALSFPEAAERAHMEHPDFRVCNKIFATLGYPDRSWAMVKLTPEQQDAFMRAEPAAFTPVKGAWGRRGCTNIRLKSAKQSSVRDALACAWRNTAPKRLVLKSGM
jgi:hypothetical protein